MLSQPLQKCWLKSKMFGLICGKYVLIRNVGSKFAKNGVDTYIKHCIKTKMFGLTSENVE